jgi:hypothetical protein
MIQVVHPGSRIRTLTFSHPGSRIQGSKRYPIPDPGSATLIKTLHISNAAQQISTQIIKISTVGPYPV